MFASALLVGFALTAVDVNGASTCPTPEEVAERLSRVQSLVGDVALTATLTPVPDGVKVELRTADGAMIAERQLSGPAACSDLAAASAAMIAAWSREFASRQQEPPTPAMPDDDLRGEVPPDEPLALRRDAPPLWAVDVGAAISASLASAGVALGGEVRASLTSLVWRAGGHVGLAALGSRSVQASDTTWERFALSAGGHYRLGGDPIAVDFHAAPAFALLSVVSRSPGSYVGFDPGGQAGVRLVSRAGFWADVRGIGWLLARELPDEGPTLPRAELLVSVGFVWSDP